MIESAETADFVKCVVFGRIIDPLTGGVIGIDTKRLGQI
jgi:hypothetical protein